MLVNIRCMDHAGCVVLIFMHIESLIKNDKDMIFMIPYTYKVLIYRDFKWCSED